MRKVLLAAVAVLAIVSGCSKQADVVSSNISTDADNFQIYRRIVFYNGITDTYMLTITGFCSLGNDSTATELNVTCKTADGYKKSFLGLSDNVTYFVEQLSAANVNPNNYEVQFKPSVVLPDVQVK